MIPPCFQTFLDLHKGSHVTHAAHGLKMVALQVVPFRPFLLTSADQAFPDAHNLTIDSHKTQAYPPAQQLQIVSRPPAAPAPLAHSPYVSDGVTGGMHGGSAGRATAGHRCHCTDDRTQRNAGRSSQ